MKYKGIPENILPHDYLVLKTNTVDYSSQPTADTSFGIMPNFLLDRMLKVNGSHFYPEDQYVSHIRLKAGRQSEGTGFGARHILSVEDHIAFILASISSQFQSTNECFYLAKFLCQLNLNNIEKMEPISYALALERHFQRFVLALDTTQFGCVHQYILIILFPDGFDLMIGTLYPINEKHFQKIKHGNERYIPVDNHLSSVTLTYRTPISSNSNPETIQKKITNKTKQVDDENNNNKIDKILSDTSASPNVSENNGEKTYPKITRKLNKKKDFYLTNLEGLIKDKMVHLSEHYFIHILKKPTQEERKTYIKMCQFDINQGPVKADICTVFKNYEKIKKYYNDTLEEIHKFIALKNLNPELDCRKLIVCIRTLTTLGANFDKETTTLIKKHDKLLALFKEVAKNFLTSADARKVMGVLQDNFDDIFVPSENKDQNYWRQVITKIREHSQDITAISEIISAYDSRTNVTVNVLHPTFGILKKQYSEIQEDISKIIQRKKELFDAIDILNVKLVKTANNLLQNFINIEGRGLLNNESLSRFFATIINKHKTTLALSCNRKNESTLLDEFTEMFKHYQFILIKNGNVIMFDHDNKTSLSSN